MKILLIHNQYQHAGGEDAVVAAEQQLLLDHGHDIELWQVDNKNLPSGLIGKAKTALATSYSHASKASAIEKIRSFKPDLVHVHNFFPQISPSIYDACIGLQTPVVQTLHNYRLICPGALLMRAGAICELCVTGSPYQAVRYGCYRGSTAGSLVVAHMVAKHRQQGTWQHKVNRFIALTDFAKAKFIEAGFPEHKISVKPNFVSTPIDNGTSQRNGQTPPYGLYVGRLSQEKGIKTLMSAWQKLPSPIPLKIAGDGNLTGLCQNQPNIELLGFQNPASIHNLMREAAFLVMPSECYEGFPMVLGEALAHGLPIITSNLGSMAEIIQHGKNGLLFEAYNPSALAAQVQYLVANPDLQQQISAAARLDYLNNYTPETNYQCLLDIYRQAIATK